MPATLADIIENKVLEVANRKAERDGSLDESSLPAGDGSFLKALSNQGINLICELKPKSPSAGVLKSEFDLPALLSAYESCAAGISVLTDEKYFGGSLDLLAEVARQSRLPILCKDFIIDPEQCLEARQAGAQAVLLIVKILTDEQLHSLYKIICRLGMTAIVEVQNDEECSRALALAPEVILINNRNLDTFRISMQTTFDLAPKIPGNIVKISASGYSNRSEIETILPYCQNFLIGSALMTADNLLETLTALKGVTVGTRGT
jgi:indole-3-glycerol phosphate synthase